MWILTGDYKYLLNSEDLKRIEFNGNENRGYEIFAFSKTDDPYLIEKVATLKEAQSIMCEIHSLMGDDGFSA